MVELPYGRTPYPLDLAGHEAIIVEPPPPPSRPPNLASLLESALDTPIERPRLDRLVRPGMRVTLILSDATRDEPRAAFLAAVRAYLPDIRLTIAIATGTHGPARLESLGLPPLSSDVTVVNHDGHSVDNLVDLGTTSRGTPVRVHRCLVDADLVIATGCIRPHYFAGFGAGIKAIFPGLGEAHAIRINHALKTHPSARAGIVEGNACRDDLEEAVRLLATPTYLLDGVCASDGNVHAAVAGDPFAAFRAGARLAHSWFAVRAPRSSLVIASDRLPVTASLYQAAKIAAAVAPLVADHGTLVVVAECPAGIGPLQIVNDAIVRIGVLPRLPSTARLHLVSSIAATEVRQTDFVPLDSFDDLLDASTTPVVVVPRASQLLIEAAS